MKNKNYDLVFALSKKTYTLMSISQLLGWDQETYMPKDGFIFRGEQLELLSSIIHKHKTHPSFRKALKSLIDLESGTILAKGLSFTQKRNLQLWRRDFLKESKLPNSFVSKFAKLTSESMTIWSQAKKENRFHLFAPYLEKIVGLCQEKVSYLGYKDHPYDALLDEHDPDRKTKEVERLFSEIGHFIPQLLQKIRAAKDIDSSFFSAKFNKETTLEFGKEILKTIGYDFMRGRLDLSNHPFSTTFHPTDSRITTRFQPHAFMECISAIIHEAGHSFYEMGMNPLYFGSPQCEAISLSIHESQSRLWETIIGQSYPFWQYFFPILKRTFKKEFEKVSLLAFYRAINKITPSPIRVDADEVSYPLHVILRFELEKALITSEIRVKDLPEAWNSLMKKFLDITPKNDSEGCLQDIHWSMGAFGYFPTYALGNLFGISFFNAFTARNKQWKKQIESGNFTSLKEFLRENIYQHGRLYSGEELLKKISSTKLSTAPYFNYLNEKYSQIYSLGKRSLD